MVHIIAGLGARADDECCS